MYAQLLKTRSHLKGSNVGKDELTASDGIKTVCADKVEVSYCLYARSSINFCLTSTVAMHSPPPASRIFAGCKVEDCPGDDLTVDHVPSLFTQLRNTSL